MWEEWQDCYSEEEIAAAIQRRWPKRWPTYGRRAVSKRLEKIGDIRTFPTTPASRQTWTVWEEWQDCYSQEEIAAAIQRRWPKRWPDYGQPAVHARLSKIGRIAEKGRPSTFGRPSRLPPDVDGVG